MVRPCILVTGANGQLGQELKEISSQYPRYNFKFYGSKDLDITNTADVQRVIHKASPAYVINCAAYTKVDDAESNEKTAYAVNTAGVANIVDAISKECLLIHFSTDYVYQSTGVIPVTEEQSTDPVNIYADSKLQGDLYAINSIKKAIVIRTSWVYSSYGHNFVKTMLRLANSLDRLTIVDDQIGSPTYAADLAQATMKIVDTKKRSSSMLNRVYHYSNRGQISWCTLAKKIFDLTGKQIKVKGIPTIEYPTAAARPLWSVLDSSALASHYGVEICDWEDSLVRCLKKIENG